MKKNVFLMIFCFFVMGFYAQQSECEKTIRKAKKILYKESPFVDQSILVSLLEPCASQGNIQAQNYLGLVYLNGIGTAVNQNIAYEYISSAASGGYPEAQYNLGRMYKYGVGCDISFDKAIYWFKKAISNGNQRAAYTLGYMYFKGFGVPQDYEKAISWFEKSTDPMARHYLGFVHYLGYGVPADKMKALEILLSNPIENSKTLVSYINFEQKEKQEIEINEALQITTDVSKPITQNIVNSSQEALQYYPEKNLELKTIEGKWEGKLIQYDWSGKYIQRVIPFKISFNLNDNNSERLEIAAKVINQNISSNAIWQDETLYLENLNDTFTLTQLYPATLDKPSLDYKILAMNLQKHTFEGQTYLIGNLDAYIQEWTEYAPPMRIVLNPESENNTLSEEAFLALADQEDHFVKLYPVPFKEQLVVQYELEETREVYAELVSLHGTNNLIILPSTQQQAGNYSYNIPVNPDLPEGLYIVRVVAGNQVHTRMILKDN